MFRLSLLSTSVCCSFLVLAMGSLSSSSFASEPLIRIEAEDFRTQRQDQKRRWYRLENASSLPDLAGVGEEKKWTRGEKSAAATASGQAFLRLLPDTRRSHDDKLIRGENFSPEPGKMAIVDYQVRFPAAGRYYVWGRAFSTGSEDNGVHVGLNGEWPAHGRRMQWCKGKHRWTWGCAQRTEKKHCGEPMEIYLDVKRAGTHTVSFSMREDGFAMDCFLLTRDKSFRPGKGDDDANEDANKDVPAARPHVAIRGVYGGAPTELLEPGKLESHGVNAIFMGTSALTTERVAKIKAQGAKVFGEFNTMHVAGYLKQHPDAAPIGIDGKPSPPPHGWQGVCPTHPGYRRFRMDEFRRVLKEYEIDGVWLDYHHSHASWERAEPAMPDTCFCERCVRKFARDTKTQLPPEPPAQRAKRLLTEHKEAWVQWRCDVFTDWVREFREIIQQTRPAALLGTYHCPWSEDDYNGALRNKLAIDLQAQSKYLDVFSIMPYHARFGHPQDPAWISRQTKWLGEHLGIEGKPNERLKIWPIVQLSDWGEEVAPAQVAAVLDHGSRKPATGVMVFNWGSLRKQQAKIDEMAKFYRAIRP